MLEPITAPTLAAIPGVRHGFFTRSGGVSTGLYAALNCGLGSRDDRSNVLENRRRVAQHLSGDGADARGIVTLHQVHSAAAVIVDRPFDGELPRADAVVTRTPGLVVGALAADCAPILLADRNGGVVAAAHAGWRGALAGVAEAAVAAMISAGAVRDRIIAVVGPCIHQESYEVGPEFEQAFLAADSAYASYFARPVVGGKSHFDLPGFVAARLRSAGLLSVSAIEACTYADGERFFSFRRTTHRAEPDYGRQVSAIVVA